MFLGDAAQNASVVKARNASMVSRSRGRETTIVRVQHWLGLKRLPATARLPQADEENRAHDQTSEPYDGLKHRWSIGVAEERMQDIAET
jgi:hypothetical protein